MSQTEHVGLTALEAEREKLLQEYDAAVLQGADDPVQTEHGISCEAHFRTFLQQFLPRKYGVTKGYIITPDLNYAGPLEEWDIIIYDAMESPVLFVRQNRDEHEQSGKRGIPVEYVRAVVEVKATFNKTNADKAVHKLLKLQQFQKDASCGPSKPEAKLPDGFKTFAIFFETKVKDAKEYIAALSSFAPFAQSVQRIFSGSLIIRGQTRRNHSASIGYTFLQSDLKSRFPRYCELSEPFQTAFDNRQGVIVSFGFGQNEFWEFMIDLVHHLNGHLQGSADNKKNTLIGQYGQRSGSIRKNARLFSQEEYDKGTVLY